MRLTVRGTALTAETTTFKAEFEGPSLKSLFDKATGTEFISRDAGHCPVELYFADGETVGEISKSRCTVHPLSDTVARILLEGPDSDCELFLRLDVETGDLCVSPGAACSRVGLRSVRWNTPLVPEANIVIPYDGGREFRAGAALPVTKRMEWPSHWNAQLAIAEHGGASLMIHSEDRSFTYKALSVSGDAAGVALGFESEQIGPLDDNRTAGGVEWRLNTYAGDWHAPADRYRDWMVRSYELDNKRADRPAWADEVTLAVCWVGNNLKLLEPLAKLNPPENTLIHQDKWREDPYDVNYPRYVASGEGRTFVAEAQAMGFRVMPHCNYFGCCKTNPLYEQVKDWQVRDIPKKEPQGWFFQIEGTDDHYQMAYIHAGLGKWRRALVDNVLGASRDLQVPAMFLDQTYHTWNTDNPPVENMTMLEGLYALQEEFAQASPSLVLAGENLTEISFQRQAFAQLHNPGWWHAQPETVAVSHPICAYLWGGHSRYVGYVGVEPDNPCLANAVAVYSKMGALPTLVARDDVAENTALIAPDAEGGKIVREWIEKETSGEIAT